MKRLVSTILVLGLLLGAGSLEAGQGGKCSPEGTWYGHNDGGEAWIVTITRSGPSSFTTVMDYGANVLDSVVVASTDWRGEFVKTGPKSYDWTTMALLRGDPNAPVPPFALGFCPLTAEFTGCDSWQGEGTCAFYGFLAYDADPFEENFPIPFGGPLQASFKRMPMSYPE